jgi:predicted 2-oxoglutarate/Fe(II)-dependent dioxygenase YbiX
MDTRTSKKLCAQGSNRKGELDAGISDKQWRQNVFFVLVVGNRVIRPLFIQL